MAIDVRLANCPLHLAQQDHIHWGTYITEYPGGARGLATYACSMSFGHPERCLLSLDTKSFGQDLLMMTILEDGACSSLRTTIPSK